MNLEMSEALAETAMPSAEEIKNDLQEISNLQNEKIDMLEELRKYSEAMKKVPRARRRLFQKKGLFVPKISFIENELNNGKSMEEIEAFIKWNKEKKHCEDGYVMKRKSYRRNKNKQILVGAAV